MKILWVTALVGLFVPATLDYGLGFETVSLSYFFAYGMAGLAVLRYGTGRTAWILGVTMAIALSMIVSTVASDNPLLDLVIAGRPVLALLCLVFVMARIADSDPDAFRRVAVSVSWVGAAVGALAVYQTDTGAWPVLDMHASSPQYTSAAYFGRPGGTQGHPVVMAAVLTAVAIATAVIRPRAWQLLVALQLIGVAVSGSRSAYLALAVALIAMSTGRRDRRSISLTKTAWLGVGAVGIVLATAWFSSSAAAVVDRLLGRLTISGDDSAAGRGLRIRFAWEQITATSKDFLLGHGPRGDVHFFTQSTVVTDGQALTFDNTYLIWWFNFGAVGLIGIMVLLLIAWRAAGKLARPLLAAVLVEMLFFDAFGWLAMMTVVAMSIGAVAFDQASHGGNGDPARSGARQRDGLTGSQGSRRSSIDRLPTRRGEGYGAGARVLDRHRGAGKDAAR